MNSEGGHVPALDGIRGIALLMVFAAHTHPQLLRSGFLGVDLFFVLSGYLITSILLGERMRTGTINVVRFYIRRALRLLPALFLMVACVTLCVAIFARADLSMTLKNAASIVFYFWNWVLVFNYGHSGWTYQWVFGHLWSLSVEEQFYILWPFVLVFSLAVSRKFFVAILILGIALPPVARVLNYDPRYIFNLYFRTDLHCDGLMWGALAAWIVANKWVPNGRWLAYAGPLALLCFIGAAWFNLFHSAIAYLGAWVPLNALAALAIVSAVHRPNAAYRIVLELLPLRWTGRISYGLYLWHLPVFFYFRDAPLETPKAILATYAIAAVSFYGMERYFLRLKSRFSHGATQGRASAAAATAPASVK